MERMSKEELKKELKKLKDFKVYAFEGDVYVKAEDYKEIAIENKKLKSDLAFERTMLDNVKAEYESLQNVIKKLKEKVSELEDVSKDYDILSKDFITATGEIEFRKDEVERFKTNAVQDMAEITELENQIKNLKEKVETLELWLDNKEKLNKGYREDVDYWHHRCMVAERGGEDEE